MNEKENTKETNLKIVESKTALFVIQARNAPVAVIFRRGPSKQVQLIKWNTAKDTFETGQWFKGRIYERRCDLSHDGEKLIYFAAKYKKPFFSWTAVSTIPYLSALLLWPKGDGWGGGGLFDTPLTISLNHRENEMGLADSFHLPKNLKIRPFGVRPGWGENNPIYHTRLLREGWKLVQDGKEHENKFGSKIWIVFDPPIEYRKTSQIVHKGAKTEFELSMQIKGLHEKDSNWYIIEYKIYDQSNKLLSDFGRLNWANWDNNGDLLFTKEGKLFRLEPNLKSENPYDLRKSKLLADFSKNRFEEKTAPKEALQW